MVWLGRAWRRVFGCRVCHGTGVIMTGKCDCGGSPWTGHEQWCDTYRCPHRCRMAQTKDDALDVWSRYWPWRPLSWRRPQLAWPPQCEDGQLCADQCGSGACSRRCQVCLRLAWGAEPAPCPACPDAWAHGRQLPARAHAR